MKNIIALIDTNVIINFITKREDPYKDACFELMKLCAENVFEGFIAFHSLSIIWYVIKKQESEGKARAWLNNICDMLTVTGATQEQIKEAIKNANFKDFEDCLQDECAVHVNAAYIVTCNVKDFKNAKTRVVTPDYFVSHIYNLISRKNYTHVIYKRLKYKEFMDSSMCIILKNHYFLYTCFAR